MISAKRRKPAGKWLESFARKCFSVGDDALGPQWWDLSPKGGDHEGLRDPGHTLLLLLAHPPCTTTPLHHSRGRARCRQGSGVTSPASDELGKPKPSLSPCWLSVGAAIAECLPAPAGRPARSKHIGIDSAINFQIPGSQAKEE